VGGQCGQHAPCPNTPYCRHMTESVKNLCILQVMPYAPLVLLRAPFNAMQPLKHLYNRLRFLGRSIGLVVSPSVQLSVRDLLERRESYRGAKVGRFWVGAAAFRWEKA
jgi:hypothetical protein